MKTVKHNKIKIEMFKSGNYKKMFKTMYYKFIIEKLYQKNAVFLLEAGIRFDTELSSSNSKRY